MADTEKEFLTLDEAAAYLGVGRATVYNYMNDLNIKTEKFGRTRRGYLSLVNVKIMRDYMDNPWKYPARPKPDEDKSVA